MVDNNLIGNKDTFAIEFYINEIRPRFGNVRIWLGGQYIGAYDDEDILGVTLHQLELLFKRNIDGEQFKDVGIEDIYHLIKSEDFDGGRYYLSLGVPFDDFSVVVYRYNNEYRFIWQLQRDNPDFEYPDYSKDFQYAAVAIDEFNKVVAEFRNAI